MVTKISFITHNLYNCAQLHRIAIANGGHKKSLSELSTAQRVNSALPIDRNSILIIKSPLHHWQPFPDQFSAQLLTYKKSSSLVMTEQSKDQFDATVP
jgi:hypothetical protein